METQITRDTGTVLLPSDYIEQGGWCTLTTSRPAGAHGHEALRYSYRENRTPEGHAFCVGGAVTASYRDGYISMEQAIQYQTLLEKHIKRMPLPGIVRLLDAVANLFYKSSSVRARGFFVTSTISSYNDILCKSQEEAVSLMRMVEDQMGLRPAPVQPASESVADQPSAGVRNIIEAKREVLAVSDEATLSRDTSRAVGA